MVADLEGVRAQIAAALAWGDAHADFDAAVANLPGDLRGTVPEGLPYSPWQLVEHMRLTQADILEFCRNPDYEELAWPDDYWPHTPEPPSAKAWNDTLAGFRRDREALQSLAGDRGIDLLARIPHGTGQTYLRELLLVLDHTSYHVGQLIAVRRLLGAWE